MLNTLSVPAEIGRAISELLPECYQLRARSLTAEESFYAAQLLKFKLTSPTPTYFIELKVKLMRYLRGQRRELFTEREWESLERLFREKFLQFCLEQIAEREAA